ncbi:hypothetical protein ACFJGW_09530 [Burkholderiaceae bacterium UC74_6]
MNGSVKELRYPLSALGLLLIVVALAMLQRSHLKAALIETERIVIAEDAISAQVGAWRFLGPNFPKGFVPDSQGDQMLPALVQANYEKRVQTMVGAQLGLIGTMGCDTWNCRYSAGLLGGRIWIDVRPIQGGEMEQLLAKNIGSGAKVGDCGAKPRKPSDDEVPCLGGKAVLFCAVVMNVPGRDAALIGDGHRFCVTNVHPVEDKVDFTVVRPQVVGAAVSWEGEPEAIQFYGLLGAEELQADATRIGEAFGVTGVNALNVYRDLRIKYEQESVTLPGVSLAVRESELLPFAFALSIGLGAWASFLMRGARMNLPKDDGAPWVLVEPFRQFRSVGWADKPLALLELVAFGIFHMACILTPLLVVGAMLLERTLPRGGLYLAAAAAGVLTASMLYSYLFIVRAAFRDSMKPTWRKVRVK